LPPGRRTDGATDLAKPHRILHIIPTLDRGGAEKQLTLLATRLPRDEFEVHVCALTRSGPLAAELLAAGVPTTVIGKRFKFDPPSYLRLERHVRSLRPDLVQTWLFAANAYGRLAALRAGTRLIVAGERAPDPWKSWRELAIDRLLARRTRAIVVNSAGVRDFYLRQRLPAELFRIVPNGIPPADPALANPSPESRAALLAELGLPADARLIAHVGRLWPQKRIKDVIWAADLIKVVHKDVHTLLIGDGPLRADLERFRRQCHIEDQVHFLGERGDVPRILPHCRLLWLASGYEGMPNAVMEAMAAGLPVVATDAPGTRELVVEGETGYLAPVGDRAGLARGAHRLLEDPELARRLGAAGQERVRREFSVEKMVDGFAALYRELLASHAAPLRAS